MLRPVALARLAALLVALAFALPVGLRAEGDSPSPEEAKRKSYESKVAAARKKAASMHASLADWCHGKKLYEPAFAEYQRVLQWDPNHSKARDRLGFSKQGEEWIEDPKKKDKVKRKDEASDNVRYALLDEYKNKAKKDGGSVADAFFDVGEWCRKNGLETEANENLRTAIDYEKDHAKAREALGFKKSGGAWVGAEDRAEKEAMQKKAAAAEGGASIDKSTADDKAVGTKLTKRQSTHFFLQTTLADPVLAELVKLAETTRSEFHTLFDVPEGRELVDGLIWGILLKEQKEYHAWIDGMVDGSEGNRDQLKRTGGHCKYEPPQYVGYEDEISGTRDFVVHYTTHVLHHYYMSPAPGVMQPWLYEGMAHYFSHRLLRTALTNCFVQATGNTNKAGVPRDSDYWKQFIREAVVNGRDPDMRIVMTAGINQLDGEMLVKAWSVLEWLMSTRKKEFFSFFEALKSTDGSGPQQEGALKETLGWAYADLDHHWREHVRKNY